MTVLDDRQGVVRFEAVRRDHHYGAADRSPDRTPPIGLSQGMGLSEGRSGIAAVRSLRGGAVRPMFRGTPAVRPRPTRPGPDRPPVAALSYSGTGVGISRARHSERRAAAAASTTATITVACLSALITLWLGWLAGLGGASSVGSGVTASAHLPEQLAVVHVQAGETLHQLAGRMVPGAPVGQVVERIRELNHLESAAIEAGQTLIAPVG